MPDLLLPGNARVTPPTWTVMLLKITPIRTEQSFTLQLCGQLTEEHIPVLDMLLSAKPETLSAPSLDLANVSFVDRAGMLYLLCARNRNIALENCPSYVIRWIEQEALCTESGLAPTVRQRP
jgi:ABC-type transporter Mla MlaB component